MLGGWRSEGLGRERLELWVVGYAGGESAVASFCGGSETSCFVDGGGVFDSFGAQKDDLFLIDQGGVARSMMNLGNQSLDSEAGKSTLDFLLRSLLP